MISRFLPSAGWYRYRREPMAVTGLLILALIVVAAAVAPWITPYPKHVGAFVDFGNTGQPPSLSHWFGTDLVGRDLFSRVIFGYRISLLAGIVVIGISAPIGTGLGLIAGYFDGPIRPIILRITDVFLGIPVLVMAMAILGFLPRTLTNGLLALAVLWWPWYARMAYNQTLALRNEPFVVAAEVIGASRFHVLARELLPNLMPSVLTKITLDLGFVILVTSALSFLGLGAQPPTPDLGSMIARGATYLPDKWWLPVFPGLAILLVVLSFNLIGDGLRRAIGGKA